MKALIVADLEGIIGVRDLKFKGNIKLLLDELKLIINVMRDFEVTNIDVCYLHDGGALLKGDELKEYQCTIYKSLGEIENPDIYNFAIMTGFHGKRKSGGRFDHTFRCDVTDVVWNGISVGEIEIYANWLRSKGIDILLISAESAAYDEVYRLGCEFFSIDGLDNVLEIADIYIRYQIKIKQSFLAYKNREPNYYKICGEPLYVYMINQDVIKNLKTCGYTCTNESIIIRDIDEFIGGLEELFRTINEVYKEIMIINIKFSRWIRSKRQYLKNCPQRIQVILDTPIEFVSKKERKEVIYYLRMSKPNIL